jgi:hypothetical protein
MVQGAGLLKTWQQCSVCSVAWEWRQRARRGMVCATSVALDLPTCTFGFWIQCSSTPALPCLLLCAGAEGIR